MSIGDSGRKAEKRTIKRLGGRAMPGSGNVAGAKGDMDKDTETHAIKLEIKSTKTETLRLQYEWCVKISEEARNVGRVPALSVQYVRPDGTPRRYGAWVMVPEWLFDELFSD